MNKKILICSIISAMLLLPFILSLLDLYCWFWFDHKITNIDWDYNSGIRICIAICAGMFGGIPLLIISDELRRQEILGIRNERKD